VAVESGRQQHLVIVGAGITGLAAARNAARKRPDIRITVIESSNRVGGKIQTVREDGFVIEGGPESWLAAKSWLTDLCGEIGLGDAIQGTRPENRGSRVLWGGRLHPIPEGLTGLIPTRLRPILTSSLLSPAGKLRLGADWVLRGRTTSDDESLSSFVTRRFGRQAYERLIEPLMAGIYAGDGGQLSTLATFPQLRAAEREHGSVIRGVIANRNRATPAAAKSGGSASPAGGQAGIAPAAARTGFISPVDGMATIVERLAADLDERGVTIRIGVRVLELRHGTGDSRFTLGLDSGETLAADAVVLATPPAVTGKLLTDDGQGVAPQAGAHLLRIPAVDSVTMTLAFRRRDITRSLCAYGYVVPRVQRRPILASTWTTSKWANRAPDDTVLFRFYVGRAGQRPSLDLPDDELEALALAEMRDVLGITATPIRRWVFRWPGGSPQYTVGHLDRVAEIERRVGEIPGLAVAGCGYHGVGIPDCVRSGERAVARVLPHLPA
jgi:oxygen-dependent protoporphyrinogen oxidase